MAIFIAYSNSGVTSGKKIRRDLKMAAILKMSKYQTQLQFDIRNGKIIQNYARKNIFRVMTMTSQSDLKVVSLYSFINERITFLVITEERTKISSSNLGYICNMDFWILILSHHAFHKHAHQRGGLSLTCVTLNRNLKTFTLITTFFLIWQWRHCLC